MIIGLKKIIKKEKTKKNLFVKSFSFKILKIHNEEIISIRKSKIAGMFSIKWENGKFIK